MNPIETRIRQAIASADTQDADSRNQIYLAARSAVLNMPGDRVEQSMELLFEGIRNIEQELGQSAYPGSMYSTPDMPRHEPPRQDASASQPGIAETQPPVRQAQNRNNVMLALLLLAGVGLFLLGAFLLVSDGNATR